MKLGVVIPNYNGAALLRQYLLSVVESARNAGVRDIIVVDDASPDDSVDVVRSLDSSLHIVQRAKNGGFGEAVNEGAAALDADLMAVCMTDMELEPGCLTAACRLFEHEDVFAVGFHLKASEGAGNAGITSLPFERGFFHAAFPDCEQPARFDRSPVNVAFAVGGAMIVRKSMFDQLGGFDPVYAPYYWEDIDLCWRAWRRNWRSVNDPEAVAWHRHPHVTIQSSSQEDMRERIVWRNRICFVRRSGISSPMLLQHRVWLALMSAKAVVTGRRILAPAARDAAVRLRQFRSTRQAGYQPGGPSTRALVEFLSTAQPFDARPAQ